MGRMLIQLGKTDQALKELEKVIDLVPDNIMAHTLLGRIYEEKGLTEKALERFEMVLLLNPTDEVIKAKVETLRKAVPDIERKVLETQEKTKLQVKTDSGVPKTEENDIRFDLPGESPGDEKTAEVAFVVREDFQGMGIATHLIEMLEKIAKENNYKGFTATVLRENAAMIRVFKKRYPNAKISVNSGSDLLIQMDFADAVKNVETKSTSKN